MSVRMPRSPVFIEATVIDRQEPYFRVDTPFCVATLNRMRGRPKKPDDEYRSDTLRIRLTESERGLLDEVGGGKTSTWARTILLKAAKRLLKRPVPRQQEVR